MTTLDGGRPETYGQRYVFSFIDRSTLSTQLRVGYTLKPDINIDLYAEPFAASGRYYDFGELPASRARDLRVYGTDGTTIALQPDGSRVVTDGASTFTLANQDFNVRSFRSNLVLRWEWRPGSTLHLVWQQDRRAREAVGERAGLGDMFRSFGATGSNYFVVKVSFWAPFDWLALARGTEESRHWRAAKRPRAAGGAPSPRPRSASCAGRAPARPSPASSG